MNNLCPCGAKKEYNDCCGYYHQKKGTPLTAEQLMRSRYSAFVVKDEDYLIQTWHKSKTQSKLNLKLPNVEWIGLKVIKVEGGMEADLRGKVEFIAEYKVNNKQGRLHEKSNFIKEDSKWLYIDGEIIS